MVVPLHTTGFVMGQSRAVTILDKRDRFPRLGRIRRICGQLNIDQGAGQQTQKSRKVVSLVFNFVDRLSTNSDQFHSV